MMGERYGTEQQRGICARALQDVFRNAHRRNKKHIATAIQVRQMLWRVTNNSYVYRRGTLQQDAFVVEHPLLCCFGC